MRDAIRYTLIAAVALCASLAAAADVTKRIDVAPGPVELRIDKPASSDYLIRWDARQPLDIQSLGPYESRTVMVVNAQPPGAQIVIDAEVIDWVAKLPTTTRFIINVGGTPPTPEPKPDDPKPPRPDVTPAPIKDPGLRVLIVYESSQLSILPTPQREILFNTVLRAWMTQNCARENNRPEWRIVDQNQPDVADTASMKALFDRPRMSVPWLVISNGTKNTGYEGVLPANYDELAKLLEAHK